MKSLFFSILLAGFSASAVYQPGAFKPTQCATGQDGTFCFGKIQGNKTLDQYVSISEARVRAVIYKVISKNGVRGHFLNGGSATVMNLQSENGLTATATVSYINNKPVSVNVQLANGNTLELKRFQVVMSPAGL